MKYRPSAVERFKAKVDTQGPTPAHRPDLGACWEWTAARNKTTGYGVFHPRHGETVTAHRYSFELYGRPLGPGEVPDHLCRNRGCVRFTHLEAVTDEENRRRGLAYRRENDLVATCRRGHPYTPENTYENPSRPTDRRCRECAREADRKRAPRGK